MEYIGGAKIMDFLRIMMSNCGVNWRVFLCSVWILISITLALYLIKRYEGPNKQSSRNEEAEENHIGVLYEDEVWKTCWKQIHPTWLMAYRIFVFFVLLIIIILNTIIYGGTTFYYYTEWTFTLITIYFGFGSLLSVYGCYREVFVDRRDELEEKQATDTRRLRQVAGFWSYIFQIIYQMLVGAVVLTDCVYWFFIAPSLAARGGKLKFLGITLHSINVVFVLGDAALNNLRFPWFRIGYFVLWTCTCVVFQWILHASITIWWPYPFLNLAQPFSPLWYLLVALFHVPCYGVFFLVIKIKHSLLKIFSPDG